MNLELVTGEPQVSKVRAIFREYQLALGVELCFQNFEEELENLPGKYVAPQGRLYLALVKDEVAGCIALKPYQECQCEMKRLYVRPEFRGQNIGRLLAQRVIDDAREIGYRAMRLDTMPTLTAALELYRTLGFREIDAYCYNPIAGVRYFELSL